MKNLKALIAEFIGTFVLVFAACGVAGFTGGELVATSLAFGLTIVAMAYSIGRISGCHINPAVSLGCLLTKRMSLKDFFLYVASQILGGACGAFTVFGLFKMGNVTLKGDACNGLVGNVPGWSIVAALVVEVILTFIFVYVILNVTDSKSESTKNTAGLIIGLTLTLVHLIGICLTGTSVNPARSLATALSSLVYNGNVTPLANVWIFFVGPLAGGALAALVFNLLHTEKDSK